MFSENCRVIRKKETIMLQMADLMGSYGEPVAGAVPEHHNYPYGRSFLTGILSILREGYRDDQREDRPGTRS